MQTYWFVIGLLLLLLNDFILKEAFGNWFTGKLSDFAGLFIFQLFWISFFPKYKKQILYCVAAIFVFWKSAWSEGFIHLWNHSAPFLINRTIDYTDILALIVLPFANYLETDKDQLRWISIHPVLPFVVSSFAFMATSQSTEIEVKKVYKIPINLEEFTCNICEINNISSIYSSKHKSFIPCDSILFYPFECIIRNSDTLIINVKDSICYESGFEVKIKVNSEDFNTKIETISVGKFCPPETNEVKELNALIESFQLKVIQPLLESN